MTRRSGTPPELAERLLEALGADPEFRDAVLGDLAEEHALRSAQHGERAAGRWYYAQTLRTAPHLLRAWARRLRPIHALRIAGFVGVTYLLVGVVVYGVLAGVEVMVERIAGSTTFPWHDPQPGGLSLGGMLLGYFVVAFSAGWLASALEKRSPVVSVMVFGITASVLTLLVPLPARAPLPAWYLIAQPIAVLMSCTLGGVFRVVTGPPTISRTTTAGL
jgi:hypothetical protein